MALSKHITKKFKNSFEIECIKLLVNAYTIIISKKTYRLDWLENDFSELLRKYVNDAQSKITCRSENKILSDTENLSKGFADKLPRNDIVFSKYHWSYGRFEIFIEAKRLKENDYDLKYNYIKEGIGRFVSKKYPFLDYMLGYLLEGNVEKTIIRINSLLEKDKRNSEILNQKPNNLHENYYESEHKRGVLKHLIFDFTKL